jgi:hypothetical protein
MNYSTHWRGVASRASTPLPLFAWADALQHSSQSNPLSFAARTLSRRLGLPPLRARVVAELAGYPAEAA